MGASGAFSAVLNDLTNLPQAVTDAQAARDAAEAAQTAAEDAAAAAALSNPGAPGGTAQLDAESKLLEAQVPERLTESGLSASTVQKNPASPAAVQAVAGKAKVGTGEVAEMTYYGGIGPAHLTVGGNLHAHIEGYEHKISNAWTGNNTLAIQNTNNSDAYSAIRFLDHEGYETAAFGYGNPGNVTDLPFAGAAYWETSTFIDPLGNPNPGVEVRPMRIVQSGVMDGTAGVFCRMEFTPDGDIGFYDQNSQFSLAVMHSRFKRDGGLQLGAATSVVGGAPDVQLDAVGTVLAGSNIDSGRPANFTGANGFDFPFATYQGNRNHVRMVRSGVGKVDLLIDTGPTRLTIGNPDYSIDPFCFTMDGTANFGIGGMTNFGGGEAVLAFKNTPNAPGGPFTDGGGLYVEAGALKYRGSSGTVTTLAPA